MLFNARKQKGEMLVNILVSIGIIALLTAVTIPYFRRFQPDLKLHSAARALTTDLRYAQQLTITEQVVHSVVFDLINKKYEVIKAEPENTVLKMVFLDAEINYGGISGLTGNQVSFNSYGGVSEAGQITFTNNYGSTVIVNIKPSGYIQLNQ